MKILKSRILLVIATIILTGSISVYAARKYYASDIEYKETTLDKALDTLYTTQNTTVNNLNSQITSKDQAISNLNNQITTLTGQVSAKDATISDLQTQLNGISTTDCIRGTATLTSACGTNSGCVIENKFIPSFLAIQVDVYNYTFIYDKKRSTTHYFESSNGKLSWYVLDDYYRMLENSVILHNVGQAYQSGTITYIACR